MKRRGYSIPELLYVLILIGFVLCIAVPRYLRALDTFAVGGARDTLLAAAARARVLAIARGGAELVVNDDATLALSTRAGPVESIDLAQRYGVRLRIENSQRRSITVRYDLLGVGRLAGATLRISRGSAEAGISFSAYGRPRVW